jgi:hypothetical protein
MSRRDRVRGTEVPSVIATPELMEAAAVDLATIGSTVSAAHMAAAAPTEAVLPAAADEVSASIAHLFSVHAQDYQGLASQAAAFHEQFLQHLTASAGSYSRAEAAAASSLQPASAIAAPDVSTITASLDQLVNSLITAIEPQLPAIFMLLEIAVIAVAVVAGLIILAPFLPAILPALYPLALLLLANGTI